MDAVDQQPTAPAPPRPWGVAGIDPHKRTFTVAVLDERGGLHGVASFDTSQQGLAEALAWLDAVEFELDRVGVEGSAWLGSQVAAFLAAAGDDVREVQASRTAERRRRRRRAKTDAETPRRSPARPWPTPTCHPLASSTLLTRSGMSWSPCATSGAA
jgi:Transposase